MFFLEVHDVTKNILQLHPWESFFSIFQNENHAKLLKFLTDRFSMAYFYFWQDKSRQHLLAGITRKQSIARSMFV